MKFKKIYIEISDICGLQCYFCPAPKGVRGIMPLSMFKRALNEAKKYTNLIALHILGDPLKLNNIKDYLALVNDTGLRVEITTSGIYLDEFAFLLNPPVRQINISIDAIFTLPTSMQKKALDKVFNFCLFRQQYQSDTFINIRVQHRSNNQEVIDMLEKHFCININSNRTRVGIKTIIEIREPFLWIDDDVNIDLVNTDSNANNTINNVACYGLIAHIGILSNGNVVPCCIDVMGKLTLGNIMNNDIKDILESPRAQAIRDGFRHNILVENVCKVCDYRKKLTRMLKKYYDFTIFR